MKKNIILIVVCNMKEHPYECIKLKKNTVPIDIDTNQDMKMVLPFLK